MYKRFLCVLMAILLSMACMISAAALTGGVSTADPISEDALPEDAPTPPPDTSVTGVIPEGLDPPKLTAQAAIVVELNSGLTLYDKNSHEARPMASLTKVMTTLLALEYGYPDIEVTAKASAFEDMERFDDKGSNQSITVGETMNFRDLLYCVMVASANEACNVIAEEVAGSVPAFIDMMNNKAKELGCKNTRFTNTHGLHEEGHYSTAYDMYLITLEAMKYPEFMEIANTTSKSIDPTNVYKERSFFTTNHLISNRVQNGYQYHLASGVKTGHHSQAGYCLISSAECDGLNIITVVMGSERTETTIMSFVETKALMEWSFDTYVFKRILANTSPVDEVPVVMGEGKDSVNIVPSRTMSALVPKILEPEDVVQLVTLNQDEVTAPVKKGQELGQLTLSYRGYTFGSIPLLADIDIKRSETEYYTDQVKTFLAEPWLIKALLGVGAFIVLYIIIVIIYNARRRRERVRGNYRGNYKGRKRR